MTSADFAQLQSMPVPEETAPLTAAEDFLALSPAQRYTQIKSVFEPWLLTEPIIFPRHHETYGWACDVPNCEAVVGDTAKGFCVGHAKEYAALRDTMTAAEFAAQATPMSSTTLGWALLRLPACSINRCPRERTSSMAKHCPKHHHLFTTAKDIDGFDEAVWRGQQVPAEPVPECVIEKCAHDGTLFGIKGDAETRICKSHRRHWFSGAGGRKSGLTWEQWKSATEAGSSVAESSQETRGTLRLTEIPEGLAREIRYGLHRHSNTAKRTHWRPGQLQDVVDILAAQGTQSLRDSQITALADEYARGSMMRRILLDLPVAARSLTLTAADSREEGWFLPMLVGAPAFPSTTGAENRILPWDLTGISQRWLRDLTWDHLQDAALATRNRPSYNTVKGRITGIKLLSVILEQSRNDAVRDTTGNVIATAGSDPARLGRDDAKAVKETWDLWFAEKIPLPSVRHGHRRGRQIGTLTESTRHTFMSGMRTVLNDSREKGRTPEKLDQFIFNLPEYPSHRSVPRPRPIAFNDFQVMVAPDNLSALDDLDINDVGYSDIWMTQAFQGGRIGETCSVRLGCVGMVGHAQPYFWRDMTKIGVIDYGVPCYLPVYERLLSRREKTLGKLRARYANQLDGLTDRQRSQIESEWDRTMPMFPRNTGNPDLTLSVTQDGFRRPFQAWFEALGLTGISTHRTRATLATDLLNNGAPPDLVREILGHISLDALSSYAQYNDSSKLKHLNHVWAAGPGMNKPGTILLKPSDVIAGDAKAAASRINLAIIPVEHGGCRYGPVVGGQSCPFGKKCTTGENGICEHYVVTGADLSYWERKRDADYHFAEGAPNDEARDYILSAWEKWEPVLSGLRQALDELGLLEAAESLDLRSPVHDYLDPLFTTGFPAAAFLAGSETDSDDSLIDIREDRTHA